MSIMNSGQRDENDIRLLQVLDLVLGQSLPSRNDAFDAIDL